MSDLYSSVVCAKEDCGRLVKKVIDAKSRVKDRIVITGIVVGLLFSFFSVSKGRPFRPSIILKIPLSQIYLCLLPGKGRWSFCTICWDIQIFP